MDEQAANPGERGVAVVAGAVHPVDDGGASRRGGAQDPPRTDRGKATPLPADERGDRAADGEAAQAALPFAAEDVAALLEALLLAAPAPPTAAELARGAALPEAAVEDALAAMAEPNGRGWVVVRHGETFHLATAPRFAADVRRFLGLDREARLSAAAIETLAVVAYRQPVTRAEVEAVRGVDCAGVLGTLLGRELIEPVGRLATVGNPIQYGTTAGFLRHFGLGSLAELPPLGEIDGEDALKLLSAASEGGGDGAADSGSV